MVPKTPRSQVTKGAMRATGRRSRRSRLSCRALSEDAIGSGAVSSGHGNRTSPSALFREASSFNQPACTKPTSNGTRSTGVPPTLTFSPMRNQSVPPSFDSSRLSSKSSAS